MMDQQDLERAIETIISGGILLYPTDTTWGLGCDATNFEAVQRINDLKNRSDDKSLIILLAETDQINDYAEAHPTLLNFIDSAEKPTTAIYPNAKNLASNVFAKDGTVAIRITRDEFCSQLIKHSCKPIVSTSANISGKPFPTDYKSIDDEIKNGVDYIVQHRQNDLNPSPPSQIIKLDEEGKIIFLRS